MINKKLEKLFEMKKRIAQKNADLSVNLDKEIEKYLGFEIPDFAMDFAVDTINEGYGNLSFVKFILELDKLKKQQEKN